MQLAAGPRIELFRAIARRNASLPMPVRLWCKISDRWQLAEQRRVERAVLSLGHDGLMADVEAARRRR